MQKNASIIKLAPNIVDTELYKELIMRISLSTRRNDRKLTRIIKITLAVWRSNKNKHIIIITPRSAFGNQNLKTNYGL